jgi:transcriptional regulator with XRE-family HTH domain
VEPFAREVGRALRRARLQRGMTLNDLAEASADRFRPTSVAGYERGERKITVVRFCELCRLLEVRPERVLGEILRSIEGRAALEIDLSSVEGARTEEGDLISGFVRQVLAQRGERDTERITIRAGDVEVLASAAGRRPEELMDILRAGRRRTRPEESAGDVTQTPREPTS